MQNTGILIRRIFAGFCLLPFLGCVSKTIRPDWIDFPSGSCGASEFCAVGIGDDSAEAKANARAEIMRWFKSEIRAFAEFSESDKDSSAEISVFDGTDGVIEGIVIKEMFEDDGENYALAAFDKSAGAAAIKLRIDGLDDKMRAMIAEDAKKNARPLSALYDERAGLNGQYHFLFGAGVPEAVVYKEISDFRNRHFKNGEAYGVDSGDPEIDSIVRAFLTENGMRVGADGKKITGKYSITEIPVNVPGFVKYQFYLELNSGGNTVRLTEYETGRSKEQAEESITPKLKAFVEENLWDLM